MISQNKKNCIRDRHKIFNEVLKRYDQHRRDLHKNRAAWKRHRRSVHLPEMRDLLHDVHPENTGGRFIDHLPVFEMAAGRFD